MDNKHEHYITTLERFITPQIDKALKDKSGEYGYISLHYDSFMKQMEVMKGCVEHDKKVEFVDVGCGIGSKLAYIKNIGYGYPSFNLHGIEITPEYAEVAKKLVPTANIIIGNALEQDYSKYDVIYFYCPLRDHKLETQLEKRIITTSKPGAIIMANLYQHDLWRMAPVQKVWHHDGGAIFKRKRGKLKTPQECCGSCKRVFRPKKNNNA